MANTREVKKSDVHMTSWLEAEEVPRSGLPDARLLNKRRRNYRIGVWVVLIMTPLVAFLSFAAISAQANAPVAEVPAARITSPGRAAAAVALDKWLASTPAPITSGRTLLWAGVIDLPAPPPPTEGVQDPEAGAAVVPEQVGTEIDTFIVIGADGSTYEAALQVAIDSVGGAAVIAGPSITPIPAMSEEALTANTGNPWPGLEDGDPTDSVDTAVQAWADSFTGGDPAALRQAVGDPDKNHTYLPLSGVGTVSAKVVHAAVPNTEGAGDQLIGRVTLTPVVPETASTKAGDTVQPVSLTYDVLIDNASTAAPVVVDWGAPGSGPTLQPFGSALAAAVPETSVGMLQPTGELSSSAAVPTVTKTVPAPAVTKTTAAPTP